MAKKLFAGNLSWDTTNESLSQFFAQAGTVTSAQVITDKYTGRGKGFGFVEMSTDEEAEKAKNELNGQTLDGRAISINEARPQQPRDNNFRGGGGGGGGDYNRDRGGRGRDDRRSDRY